MADARWMNARGGSRRTILAATALTAAIIVAAVVVYTLLPVGSQGPTRQAAAAAAVPGAVMLILRGIASADEPRGQLDDDSALEYARQLGYQGEVLDVAGNTGADSRQVRMALDRIRTDETVAAIYGFSGGGYNARQIWKELDDDERARIGKVVVVGSPGVTRRDFPDAEDVLIKPDPPEGHMAGPKVLLETVGSGGGE